MPPDPWQDHALRRVLPLMRDLADGVAAAGQQLMIVADDQAHLLWIGGDRRVRAQATDGRGAVAGTRGDGSSAGTNGVGLALVRDHALQAVAGEPFDEAVQTWTCAAAPVHDPAGRLLGVIIIAGRFETDPHNRSLLAATARAVEAHVRNEQLERDVGRSIPPGERTPKPYAPTLAVAALARDRAVASLGGRDVELSQRRSELLVLLAGRPEGMTAEELALAVYGDSGKPATVRGELFRLRRLLGRWLRAEPYRLAVDVDADFLGVRELLRAGRVLEAAQRYPAALLPHSEAPGVIDARDELDGWLRRAVLSAGDRETLWAWLQSGSGRGDLQAWKRFLAGLDYGDARRPEAAARLAQLRDSLDRSD